MQRCLPDRQGRSSKISTSLCFYKIFQVVDKGRGEEVKKNVRTEKREDLDQSGGLMKESERK